MKRHSRVVWSNGTFLTPQLFEAQERFLEGEVQFGWSLGGFERWGIADVEIDTTSLANKKICITRCSGVLDDGFAFSMPDADPLPEVREFATLQPDIRVPGSSAPGQPGLNVFLAIPVRQERERNIARPGGPRLRFTAQDQTICNDLDGQEETIEVAKPNFHLVFGGESTSGLNTLPIARIRNGTKEPYELDPEFIPPCLNAASSAHLWAMLSALLERLEFVSVQLSKERSDRSELIADFSDSDIRRFWVLHIVNRAYPELKHIHSIRHAHPEQLYRFLVRLQGALCTFSKNHAVTNVPAYDHRNLGGCLLAVVNEITTMLRTMVYRKRRCVPVQVVVVEINRHFRAAVTEQQIKHETFYVAVRSSTAISNIEENLKIVGLVTSETAETLAGLQLSLEQRAPVDCAQREGFFYYRILQPSAETVLTTRYGTASAPGRGGSRQDREGQSKALRRLEVWQDIIENEKLDLVILNQTAVPSVELFVVGPEASGYAPLPDDLKSADRG